MERTITWQKTGGKTHLVVVTDVTDAFESALARWYTSQAESWLNATPLPWSPQAQMQGCYPTQTLFGFGNQLTAVLGL